MFDDTCPGCHGKGWVEDRVCNGSGRVACPDHTGPDCPLCGGDGLVVCNNCHGIGSLRCPRCDGTGHV